MIYISGDVTGDGRAAGYVVYHTGPDGDSPGIVKKITLKDLTGHPDRRWHPVGSNPYFLGVYRWKFLDQATAP